MQDSTQRPEGACLSCEKNAVLLKKYQKLVGLYNKKKHRESEELSSRISQGRTTSHTSGIDCREHRSLRMCYCLQIIFYRKCAPFFMKIAQPSVKKYVISSLVNKISKLAKKTALKRLVESSCVGRNGAGRILQKLFLSKVKGTFSQLKVHGEPTNFQKHLSQNCINEKNCEERVIKALENIREGLLVKKENSSSLLTRENIELKIENEKLRLENQYLRGCLEESTRRQVKENQKKKESLEMLAEQLEEKNELIKELTNTLKGYEEKFETNGNVLEDDVVSLKKEVDNLETIRDRLDNELSKVREKLSDANEKIVDYEKKCSEYEEETSKMRKSLFEEEIKSKQCNLKEKMYQEAISIFSRKIKRVSLHERELEEIGSTSNLLTSQDKNSVNRNQRKQRKQSDRSFIPLGSRIMQDTKTELVLCYLANVQEPDYDLKGEGLFDQEELFFLLEHKNKYLTLKTEKENAENYRIEPHHHMDFHQVEMRGNACASVFSALDSPKNMDSGDEGVIERVKGEGSRSLSLKLLELELEKNRQIEKISEVKQKMMHIRVIILNLLKALQIQSMKPEAQGVLNVILDMFEYSEEERESIIVKKKKYFGFI